MKNGLLRNDGGRRNLCLKFLQLELALPHFGPSLSMGISFRYGTIVKVLS